MTATYGDKTREGYRMRVTRLGDLLEWRSGHEDELGALFDVLVTFFRSETPDLASRSLLQVSRVLPRLHVAFCDHFAFQEHACKEHRKWLRRWSARRLRWFAIGQADRRKWSGALAIFGLALRTDPRIAFDKRNFQGFGKLFRGRRRAQAGMDVA